MRCVKCGRDIAIQRQFCPHCGQRVEVQFDEVAASVQVDAARRRGRELDFYLAWGLAAVIFLGGLAVGFNYLWDERLVYDGADLPSVPAPVLGKSEAARIPLTYHDVFQLTAPPGRAPRVFGYRFLPLRDELRAANSSAAGAGSVAIRSALGYLSRNQNADGSWPVTARDLHIVRERDETLAHQWARTGLTALALLAFLGEGETWFPDPLGVTSSNANVVRRAVAYLVQNQDQANGRFGPAEGNFMYNHGLATLALAEAAGLSGDPFLRAAAQKGVDLIERPKAPRAAGTTRTRSPAGRTAR